MSDHHDDIAFEPAVATRLDDVVAAMQQTHDALIRRWRNRRRSGIRWHLYGPELAIYMARAAFRTDGNITGTFDEGMTALREMVANSDGRRDVDRVLDDIRELELHATQHHPHPTLVIAYCEIRNTSRSRRP